MEFDEIAVVLVRASHLQAKISDAIERARNHEFLLSNGATCILDGSVTHISDGAQKSPDFVRRILDKSEIDGDWGRENEEARSLAAIRNAMEILEDQLTCLQALQQQQRVEKDVVLAELEESRRILLRRLKAHHGKEQEVVYEILAFAGEPVDERDDLPLPPYTTPLLGYSGIIDTLDGHLPRVDMAKRLMISKWQDSSGEISQEDEISGNGYKKDGEGVKRHFWVSPHNFVKLIKGLFHRGVRAKLSMVAATLVAFMLFSETRQRLVDRMRSDVETTTLISSLKPVTQAKRFLTSSTQTEEVKFPKAEVREKVETPTIKVKVPDVFYGRG